MKRYHYYLLKFSPYRLLIKKLKSTHYGEKQVSLYFTAELFMQLVNNDDLESKASSIAFKFTLSLFPAIIFLFSLIPYIPITNLEGHILNFIDDVMPASIYETVDSTIRDIISKPRGGLLSFGFIIALYLANNGIVGLMSEFNKYYETAESRSWITVRLTALLLTFLLAFVLIFTIISLIMSKFIFGLLLSHGILNESFAFYLLVVLKYLLIVFLFFFMISFIYYLAPVAHRKWKFLSPGSIISTLLCLLSSFLFAFYLNNFATYNKLYGSIGVMVGIMVWIYVISLMLLVGFQINLSVEEAYRNTKKNTPRRKA